MSKSKAITYHPTGHRVLIKVDKAETESAGGIIIPDSSSRVKQTHMERGTVVELGQTAYLEFEGPAWVKEGDRVCFKRYEGIEIQQEDCEDVLRVVNDDDIYAIIS